MEFKWSLPKETKSYLNFFWNYKNPFEMINQKFKKNLYSGKLIKFLGDANKTWCIMKDLIWKSKIDISSFPSKIVIDKTDIVAETEIANEFNNFFIIIGPKLAQKIPQPL